MTTDHGHARSESQRLTIEERIPAASTTSIASATFSHIFAQAGKLFKKTLLCEFVQICSRYQYDRWNGLLPRGYKTTSRMVQASTVFLDLLAYLRSCRLLTPCWHRASVVFEPSR